MKSAIFMRRGGIDVDFVFSREALQARFVKYFTSRSRRPAIRFSASGRGDRFLLFRGVRQEEKFCFLATKFSCHSRGGFLREHARDNLASRNAHGAGASQRPFRC
jgi:hypothetical protein